MKNKFVFLLPLLLVTFGCQTRDDISESEKTEKPTPTEIFESISIHQDVMETRREYIEDITKFTASWEGNWQSPSWMHDFKEKYEQLPSKSGRIMAFGHRGDIEHYPENSIEGIISAVKMGADGVEIDCQYTKDGVIVLNHTDTLAESTDWSKKFGKVIDGVQLPKSNKIKDWTYEELTKLNLRYELGQYSSTSSPISEYKIATLEEAMIVAKNRCFLSLDRMQSGGLQSPDWQNVYHLMKKTGAYTSVLYLNMAGTKAEAEDLKNFVKQDAGVDTITVYERTGSHNFANDWYAEFDFTTPSQYSNFFEELSHRGTYLLSNRLMHLIDWIDARYTK